MSQPTIASYGLIGDTRTAALSSLDGSIDWLCLPNFDSDPVFGFLIGGHESGRFSLRFEDVDTATRRYHSESPVLSTTFKTSAGEATLTELMVSNVAHSLMPHNVLIRRIEVRGGPITCRVLFAPRKGTARNPPRSYRKWDALICNWGSFCLSLQTFPPVEIKPGIEESLRLNHGDSITFAMHVADRTPIILLSETETKRAINEEISWWQTWAKSIKYSGEYQDLVVRSLITLKLLTFSPSGAPVAAPTTSLPEAIGESSNWDYRYSWPRDAAVAVEAFVQSGMPDEALNFMGWLQHAARLTRPRIQVMYTLYGRKPPDEKEFEHLDGYLGSKPVRFGNKAAHQTQFDVYGWVLEAAYQLVSSGTRISNEMWRVIKSATDYITEIWDQPDHGIWEVRGEKKHYVHSKMMMLLALNRTIEMVKRYGANHRRIDRWNKAAESLKTTLYNEGIDQSSESFVRSYGSDDFDAAVLFPLPLLEPYPSTLLHQTIESVRKQLEISDHLLYRYSPEKAHSPNEGAFVACSFWLAGAMARDHRPDEALEIFEAAASRANELGLFSEMSHPETKIMLGNFPQALSHSTLVQSAQILSQTM